MFNNGQWAFDYNDEEVLKRQRITPNASCDVDGVFYDMQNCVHEIKRLKEGAIAWEKLFFEQCYEICDLKEENQNMRKTMADIVNNLPNNEIEKTVNKFIIQIRNDFHKALLKKEF